MTKRKEIDLNTYELVIPNQGIRVIFTEQILSLFQEEISMGIVIELKYSESRNLEATCLQALAQIEEKDYADQLVEEDMTTILKYGIACRRNSCMVRMADS